MMTDKKNHVWHFLRSAGFDQVCIEQGADLTHLAELDAKLWTTLACPVKGLRFDATTLSCLDSDQDGRIRVPEVVAAVQFVLEALRTPDLVFGVKSLNLDDFNKETDIGVRLQQSAKELRQMLQLPDAEPLALEHVLDRGRLFPVQHPNGDGIIPLQFTEDSQLQTVLSCIMQEEGQVADRSGEPGVSVELLDRYFLRVQTTLDWLQSEPQQEGLDFALIWPIFQAIAPKIDDYFARCQLIVFDESARECLGSVRNRFMAINEQLISVDAPEVRGLPLAPLREELILTLDSTINPAWQEALSALFAVLVQPLLNQTTTLSLIEWKQLCLLMRQYDRWLQAEPTDRVLPERAVLQQWLQQGIQERLQALIASDLIVKEEADAIMAVDKLLHYQRYLVDFLNNFVTFRYFYSLRQPAVFQAGRLFIDQRSCDLCVEVADLNQHLAMAGLSRTYLVYCLLHRAGETDKYLVAAVTAGDAGHIMVGRHAVFFDYEGRDWDATVLRLIENPISVREAFWTPYRKLGQMLGEQVQKLAKAREQNFEKSAVSEIDRSLKPSAAVSAQASSMDIGRFAGIFAAIGLAVGAIGTALASVVTGLLSLHWWQIPLVPPGLMLIISGPSMVIAWFKLHARNLGPILEGNGWAINTHARINIAFGTTLTQLATLPAMSQRSLRDPYAAPGTKRYWWLTVGLVVALVLLWFLLKHR